ncbi:MAG TPA: dNTP triphosphohydrolase [Thermomicrobiales bacterium]|nr:dNTP triphosphohydrolase [Thermomicrobiales bacterium]
MLAGRFDRRYAEAESVSQVGDPRSAARHDRDRILYSFALRRLSGITQVITPAGSHPTHNRLTHTLEVAQIGRSLAERLLVLQPDTDFDALGGLDPDVVEAAALAHDLGHPPFGHVAETELDRLVRLGYGVADGFEGNAQSFRILTRLLVRHRDRDGLNLTRATLSASTKYPWLRDIEREGPQKWGAYRSEAQELAWSRQHLPNQDARTIEADVMNWADDVAYAVHDLDDFFRVGAIPLDRLASDERERERFLIAYGERRKIDPADGEQQRRVFDGLLGFMPVTGPYQGSREDQARSRSLVSTLVHRYVTNTSVDASGLRIEPLLREEVNLLKGVTWHYVIDSRALVTQRYGHTQLIRSLFGMLADNAAEAKTQGEMSRLLPVFYQQMVRDGGYDDAVIVRAVADYISSMTESQVVDLHHRLTGISLGSALDPIVL